MMPTTDTPTPEPMALGIAEIQQATSVGRTYIYDAIRSGDLVTFTAGRRRLATREAVADWVAKLAGQSAA